MNCDIAWKLDRQVVLTQLQNVVLTLRSSPRFSSKSRFISTGQQAADHPLLQGAIDLRNLLLSCAGLAQPPATTPGGSDAGQRDTAGRESAHAFSATAMRAITEADIIAPFVAVCGGSDSVDAVRSVALSGLVAMIERPCAFLTARGVSAALEAAASARSDTAAPNATHEVLVARIIQVYVACIRHPAAAELPEEVYVRAVSRTLVLALRPETSPLLKRTAECAMKAIVTALYDRVTGGGGGGPAGASPLTNASAIDGTPMMRYVSSLVSGEVTALDGEGHTIAASTSPGSSGADISPQRKAGGRARAGGAGPMVVVFDSGPAIQLEGLWLAQAALFAIQHHLSDRGAARLRHAVQNDLSRALLIAGVGTSHVVVLSQIVRTIHVAAKCAAEHLIPQMDSFLRVLHLNPLAALTAELDRAELSSPSGNRNPSPFPPDGGSPTGPGSPTSAAPYLSSSRIMDLYERKEVLLESLAEFCSDPGFLFFCYAHFDLSWHYAPLIPQLCDVLVNNAYGYEYCEDAAAGGGGGGVHSGRSGSRIGSEAGGSGGRTLTTGAARPVGKLQLVALDAATNMVAEVAVRTVAAAHTGGGSGDVAHIRLVLPAPSGSSECPDPLDEGAVRTAVEQMLRQKKLLLRFAGLFEESACKKGVPFLLEHAARAASAAEEARLTREGRTWLVVRDPAGGHEIGHALFRLSVLLDKRALGDHIGDLGRERVSKPEAGAMVGICPDGTVVPLAQTGSTATTIGDANGSSGSAEEAATKAPPQPPAPAGVKIVPALEVWERNRESDHLVVGTIRFYEEQLRGFIEMFDFKGKSLLPAIREMVYRLCLPGESQKIDRIMEAFAQHWYAQNAGGDPAVNPFHSDSGAFVLSFAIIMLNTTCHSRRFDRTLTLADFRGMNRGIDEGNNVPEEYLTAIYEDVSRHEVIMAEMMDRGFANDVTWDLEMNDVRSRSFHGVAGTLENMLELVRDDNDSDDADDDGGSAGGREDGTVHPMSSSLTRFEGRDAPVALVLDPYVFQILWKRCLLIFNGMADSAGAQVSRLNPRGTTIKDAVKHARALMPTEVSALVSSLRGIQMLARAAAALSVDSAADQCMMTLLPHVTLELVNTQDVVDGLYRSLPKLLCARDIFALLATDASSLADSWPMLADFILKLYLLGFLASAPSEEKGVAAPAPSGGSTALPAVLVANPGIVDSESQLRHRGASGGGGGWFSSFFGGGGGSGQSGEQSGSHDGGNQAAESPASNVIVSQPRVRECVPDMPQLMRMVAAMPKSFRDRLASALIASRCPTAAQRDVAVTPQEAFVVSYEVCLVAAITLAPLPAGNGAAAAAGDDSGSREAGPSSASSAGTAADGPAAMMELVTQLRNTVPRALEVVAMQSQLQQQRRRGDAAAAQSAGGDPLADYWCGIAERLVSGVLSVVAFSLAAADAAAEAAGTAMTHAAMEGVWHILQVYLEVDRPLYNAYVALPLARLLERWMGHLAQRATPLPHGAPDTRVLVPLAARAAAALDRSAPVAAVATLSRACAKIATCRLYDVTYHTETLADAALALGIVRGQQDDDAAQNSGSNGSGSSGLVFPHSSATLRTGGSSLPASAVNRAHAHGEALGDGREVGPCDIISICSRNVLHAARESGRAAAADAAAAAIAGWLKLWMLCLRRLAGLVVCAGSPRAGSESLLCLQRALQDTELDAIPAATIQAVYDEVLFPLVELICAPGSEVTFARPACSASHGTAAGANSQQQQSAGLSASLFGAAEPAAAAKGRAVGPAHAAPNGKPPSWLLPIVPAEVKCRVVNLLPKVLLQYISSLAECPDVLQDLWRRVLGTLYAMFTAYPSGAPSAAASSGDVDAELLSDEALLMREAVEETVKNMVYVVAATSGEAGSIFQRVPLFLTSTRNLIRPFSFAGPLIEFLDSSDGNAEAGGGSSPPRE